MTDQPSPNSGSTFGTDRIRANFRTEDEHRSHSRRERSLEVVVLLDYIAGALGMFTAGIYLTLKVLNERFFPGHPQNFVFRLIVESQRLASALGLAGDPGLSRIPFLVRFMLGGILGLFVVGCLSTFFWVSAPAVILLRRFTL